MFADFQTNTSLPEMTILVRSKNHMGLIIIEIEDNIGSLRKATKIHDKSNTGIIDGNILAYSYDHNAEHY